MELDHSALAWATFAAAVGIALLPALPKFLLRRVLSESAPSRKWRWAKLTLAYLRWPLVACLIATATASSVIQLKKEASAVGKARFQLWEIARAIDTYRDERGSLPPSLGAIGASSTLDPWGNEYRWDPKADCLRSDGPDRTPLTRDDILVRRC